MNKKLRVWWMPQVPMESMKIDVKDIAEAVKIMEVLADYDRFQFENNVKPDYSNEGGVEQEGEDGWEDWDTESEALGYFDNPEEYLEQLWSESLKHAESRKPLMCHCDMCIKLQRGEYE